MKFSKIFKEVAQLYPKEISLKNARIEDNDNLLLPELESITNTIELFYNKDDDWQQLMNWIISVNVWSLAKQLFEKGETIIYLKDIPLKEIEIGFYKNLQHESYADMLEEYNREIEINLGKYWGKNPITPNPKLSKYEWVVTDSTGKHTTRVDKEGNILPKEV